MSSSGALDDLDAVALASVADLVFDAARAQHPGVRPVTDDVAQAQLDAWRRGPGTEQVPVAERWPAALVEDLLQMLIPDRSQFHVDDGQWSYFVNLGLRHGSVAVRDEHGHVTNRSCAVKDDPDGLPQLVFALDQPVECLLVELAPHCSPAQLVGVLCQLVGVVSDALSAGHRLPGVFDALERNLGLLLGCLRLSARQPHTAATDQQGEAGDDERGDVHDADAIGTDLSSRGGLAAYRADLASTKFMDEPSRANPLSAVEAQHHAAALRRLLAALDRQVVELAFLDHGESDLLDAVRQPVDGLGELPNGRVLAGLQLDGLGRGGLAFLDALKDEIASALHGDSSDTRGPESPAVATVRTSGLDSAALDAVAVILTEIKDLLADPTVASNKVATIRAAAEDLELHAGGMSSPFVTHVNGVLADRYTRAREALR